MTDMNTPAPIRLLSRQLANQIAAGEVVERPASILKELLENSLDAGASQIEIDTEQGGIKRIIIRDDGHGIAADELALAVARHATSKISTLNDLENIRSMGFRGEALASISSVTHMQITSRQRDSAQAWRLHCVDPDSPQEKPVPASHPVGTSIETTDLFYNTPARRKFLRSERTEYRHMEDVIKRVVLSHFDVGFIFKHNQREIYRLPVTGDLAAQERRIARVCGKSFLQQARHIDFNASGLRLWGWALPPEFSRSQADIQFFFVNQRIIKDRVISHALRQAYEDRLHPGRHPAYVLYLELDPGQVDVNVHPTKHEVRFHESRLVHDFLAHSLLQTFRDSTLSISAQPDNNPLSSLDYVKPATGNRSARNTDSYSMQSNCNRTSIKPQQVAESLTAYARMSEPSLSKHARLTSLAVVYPYLIARNESGLLLLDIVAAKTTLLTSRLEQYLQQGAISQPVLFPIQMQVTESQSHLLGNNLFKQLGFVIKQIDAETILIQQVPALIGTHSIQQGLQLALGEMLAQGNTDTPDMIKLFAHCFVQTEPVSELALTAMNTLLLQLETEQLLFDPAVCQQLEPDDLATWFSDKTND
ncbi:MAG: DNA mismatch repair endonuclease MutL [Gammaproteobacteria bacterium]|nr:DNA mismatch repair endonuclease MutL [Gammaproteobacteria bacterium]